jgi:predicted ATPase
VQSQADALSEICRERGFAQFVAMTTMLRGWSLAAQDNAGEGIALIQEGLDAIRATGVSRLAFQLALLAEACSWAGEVERGLTAVVEAEAAIESTGERLWEAEVLRLKGRLLLAGSAPDRVESEASLKQAIDVARKQDTKWFELRAAMSLAQLWAEQGRRAEAHDLLAPIYGWFTEGFETKDLKDAKQLLGELRC